jgi:hypothetical protein
MRVAELLPAVGGTQRTALPEGHAMTHTCLKATRM